MIFQTKCLLRQLTLAAIFAYLLTASAATETQTRPNVLLILSDDHSFPHVGAYGSNNCAKFELTPHLDALAAEGVRFDRTYTASPQCAPSRTAIFTGRSPVGLSSTRFSHPARASVPFFTDLLRAGGYWVGLDGRNQHLDGKKSDLKHVQETLTALGMRGPKLEDRFDHFVGGVKTRPPPRWSRWVKKWGLFLSACRKDSPGFCTSVLLNRIAPGEMTTRGLILRS